MKVSELGRGCGRNVYPYATLWKAGLEIFALHIWGLSKNAFVWDTEESVYGVCAGADLLVLLPHIPRGVRMQGDWQALLNYNLKKKKNVRNMTGTNI